MDNIYQGRYKPCFQLVGLIFMDLKLDFLFTQFAVTL